MSFDVLEGRNRGMALWLTCWTWHKHIRLHWDLQYCRIEQYVLLYFSNFNLEMWYCGLLQTCRMHFFKAIWMVLKVIFQVLQHFPSLFQFLIGHSQRNLALMVTENHNSLCRNKRVSFLLLILLADTPMDVTYFV